MILIFGEFRTMSGLQEMKIRIVRGKNAPFQIKNRANKK